MFRLHPWVYTGAIALPLFKSGDSGNFYKVYEMFVSNVASYDTVVLFKMACAALCEVTTHIVRVARCRAQIVARADFQARKTLEIAKLLLSIKEEVRSKNKEESKEESKEDDCEWQNSRIASLLCTYPPIFRVVRDACQRRINWLPKESVLQEQLLMDIAQLLDNASREHIQSGLPKTVRELEEKERVEDENEVLDTLMDEVLGGGEEGAEDLEA